MQVQQVQYCFPMSPDPGCNWGLATQLNIHKSATEGCTSSSPSCTLVKAESPTDSRVFQNKKHIHNFLPPFSSASESMRRKMFSKALTGLKDAKQKHKAQEEAKAWHLLGSSAVLLVSSPTDPPHVHFLGQSKHKGLLTHLLNVSSFQSPGRNECLSKSSDGTFY